MTPQEILQKFAARQLTTVYGESGGISRLELFHAVGDTSERLAVFPVEVGETKSDEIATEIFDVANQDRVARASATPERYGIAAFTEDDELPKGQCSFTLEGTRTATLSTFDDSEPPNQRGLTGQLMRHNEKLFQMSMQMVEVMSGRVVSENHQLRNQLDRYIAREDESRQLKEKLLDESSTRELAQAEALMKAKRKDQLGGMLLSMAPAVLSTFFAKKGMPAASGNAAEQSVKTLMKELSEKEVMGIMGALSPEHQMAMLTLYKQFQGETKKEDQGKPKILQACEEAM